MKLLSDMLSFPVKHIGRRARRGVFEDPLVERLLPRSIAWAVGVQVITQL